MKNSIEMIKNEQSDNLKKNGQTFINESEH